MKRLKALPWYWYGFVIVIFLCLMEIWGILGNWSTIVLAVFTMAYVFFLHKSISQTSNLRKEDRKLDFSRRKLDWIVIWAREVRKELLIPRFMDFQNLAELRRALQNYAVENEEIIMAAKIFGEEFQRIVEKAAKDLWAYIEALKKSNDTTIDHTSYIRDLGRSFSKVLQSALKLESDLVKTSHKM